MKTESDEYNNFPSDLNHLVNSLFVSVFSFAIVLVFFISKIGFELDSSFQALKCFLYLNLLIFLPSLFRHHFKNKSSLFGEFESNSLALLLLMPLLAFWSKEIQIEFFLCLAGFCALIASIKLVVNKGKIKRFLFPSLIALSLGSWAGFFMFASAYHPSLLLERIPIQKEILSGSGVVDLFYHSSITNMISLFGYASTGLDGPVRLDYHVGSHTLFAQICKILNLNSLTFYQVGFATIIVPLLLKAILTFIQSLRGNSSVSIFSNPLAIAILCLGFTCFVPAIWGESIGLWLSVFASESHCLALIYVILFLSSLLEITSSIERRAGFIEYLFSFFPCLLLLLLLVTTKTSAGALILAISVYLFLRYQCFRNLKMSFIFFMAMVSSLALYFSMSAYITTYESAFEIVPFGFYKKWIPLQYLAAHFCLFYLWSTLAIVLQFKQNNIGSLNEFWCRFKEKKLVQSEVIFLFCLFGTVPALLNIAGANAIYFSDVQYWVALPIVISHIFDQSLQNYKRRGTTIFMAASVVLLALNFVVTINLFFREQIAVRKAVKSKMLVHGNKAADYSKVKMLLTALRRISTETATDRAKIAVFIPRETQYYWNLFDCPQFQNNAIALLGPSLSGTCFLYGLPPLRIDRELYGFSAYDFNYVDRSEILAKADVVTKAKNLGFDKVYFWSGSEFETILIEY